MTTQAFVSTYNPQSITWATFGALWAVLRTLALLLAGGVVLAAIFAAVAAIPVTFWSGALLTLAFALATYPRKAVRK